MHHIHLWCWWDLPHRHHNGKYCHVLDGVRVDWSGNRWRTVSDQEKRKVWWQNSKRKYRPQMEGMVVGLFTSRHESGRSESVSLTSFLTDISHDLPYHTEVLWLKPRFRFKGQYLPRWTWTDQYLHTLTALTAKVLCMFGSTYLLLTSFFRNEHQ